MTTQRGTALVTSQDRSENHKITGSDMSDLHFENSKDAENLQADLTLHLNRHKKVRKMSRCFSCSQPKNPLRMSSLPMICKVCLSEFRVKGPTAQNNFIERLKLNVGVLVRRCA